MSCVGPPLAPTISPIARADFKSFNVTLYTTGSSARCFLIYFLTITENGEPLTALAIIGSNGTGSVGGLNLCKNMYTFSAVAMTKDMNSSISGPVAGLVDFSGMLMPSVFNAVSKIKGKYMSKTFKIKKEVFSCCSSCSICLVAIFHVLEVYCLSISKLWLFVPMLFHFYEVKKLEYGGTESEGSFRSNHDASYMMIT